MPIPDYGLWNKGHTQQILSRDNRFNHAWYVAKKLDYYDNFTADDIGWPSDGNSPNWPGAIPPLPPSTICPVL